MGWTSCQPAEKRPFAGISTNNVLSADSSIRNADINRCFLIFQVIKHLLLGLWWKGLIQWKQMTFRQQLSQKLSNLNSLLLLKFVFISGCLEELKRCQCDLIAAYCDIVVQYGGSLLRRTVSVQMVVQHARQMAECGRGPLQERPSQPQRFGKSLNMSQYFHYRETFEEKSEF